MTTLNTWRVTLAVAGTRALVRDTVNAADPMDAFNRAVYTNKVHVDTVRRVLIVRADERVPDGWSHVDTSTEEHVA